MRPSEGKILTTPVAKTEVPQNDFKREGGGAATAIEVRQEMEDHP